MNSACVISRDIKSVGYDATSQILEAEFISGIAIYQYFGVPKSIYEGLMAATGHGRYFTTHVRRGEYRFRKMG